MFYWIFVYTFVVIFNFYNFGLSAATGTGPCVLIDSGPVPSSLCIPSDVINEVFHEARNRVGLGEPFRGPLLDQHHLDQVDKLGLAITETTRVLASKYNLNHHQIFHLLPKLDLSLTDVSKFCPAHFQHKVCELSRYRSLSGHCNNIRYPDWGATFVPFQNLLPPHHPDGVSEPRGFEHGYLPSPRLVSSTMHRDAMVHDHAITVMLIAWGQIIDHDITLTGDTKDPYTLKDPECCSPTHYGKYHHNCFPIKVPQNDPFYSHYGQHCMNFARSLAALRSDCRLGTRKAFNKISSFLDASFVYGSDNILGSNLRLGKQGLLKSLPIFEKLGLKELLPLKLEEPDDGCLRRNPDMYCFLAGDIRVNEQLVLTVLHTIFMREHNRIATILGHINLHWDDERIFQETRRIIIAITQHITFNEFLPMILGKYTMQNYGLALQTEGYWTGYDPTVDPTAAEEFVTSAFRFGHSLLPQRIERWSHGHNFLGSEDLHKLIRQPYDIYRPGYADTFILGMVNQLAQAMDEGVTEQVTTLLFKEHHLPYGMDLAAMNLQRGREHGVPGYSAYREICGLSPISTWDDLAGVMRNETIYRYKSIYKTPHDIDLWSGGVSELQEKGSLLGPTFSCIIARQFRALKYGDRFWYESPEPVSRFTHDQLREIKEVRLSRLLCDNSDDLKTVQIYAMVLPDNQINPRVPCKADIIPRIDLEKWREVPVVTDIEELINEHDHTYPHNYQNNYETFEYQHEHEIEQSPHLHGYGSNYGYGPSPLRTDDIHITTPGPPIIPYHQPAKIQLSSVEPNYEYGHNNGEYGQDYGYSPNGIHVSAIDITTPAPEINNHYQHHHPAEKIVHKHRNYTSTSSHAIYGEHANFPNPATIDYGYGPGSGIRVSAIDITTPPPYLHTHQHEQHPQYHDHDHKLISNHPNYVNNESPASSIQIPYDQGYEIDAHNHKPKSMTHHHHHNAHSNEPRSKKLKQRLRDYVEPETFAPIYGHADDDDISMTHSHSQPSQQQSHSSSVGVPVIGPVPRPKLGPIVKIIAPPKSSRKFQPFPDSPLPGWSGIFSPNPGYLVRQKFEVYRAPAYIPPPPPQRGKGIWKGIG